MKRLIILSSLLVLAIIAKASITFSASDFKIKAGETKKLDITLTNTEEFSSFQFDLVLPQGLSVTGKGKKQQVILAGIVEEYSYDYAVGTTSDGNYGIRVYSTEEGMTIDPSDGVVLQVNLKADENATLGNGTIQIVNIILSKGGQAVDLNPINVAVNIYKEFNVTPVTSDENKGAVSGGGTFELGSSVTLSATPVEGYQFVSWNDATNTLVSTENPYIFTALEDATFTATWTPITYAVSYELGGGTLGDGVTNAASYTIESDAITLTNPTRMGYTFAGWTGTGLTESTSSVTIAKGSTGDRSYTATWTPITYAISYELGGGILGDGVTNAASYTIESDAITLTNPTRTGYTFAGWTGTGLTESTSSVTIAKGSIGDRSYTATWTINQYTMTFVLDNGEDNVEKQQNYGSALTAPSDLKKAGFTFKGWNPEVPATIPAEDKTFTAQWERNSYKVTWDVDGIKTVDEYAFEAIITRPADPKKEGYTFTGWTPNVAETMPAEDVTYTAQFSQIEVELSETSIEVPLISEAGVKAIVKRVIKKDVWSTICLPFSMTTDQVKAAFGNEVELGDFSGVKTKLAAGKVVGLDVTFTTTTSIEANHPYIIKVTKTIDQQFEVDGVKIEPQTDLSVKKGDNSFVGTYVVTKVPENGLFLGEGGFQYSKGLTSMNAFRAYFDFSDASIEVATRINLIVDGETTEVRMLENAPLITNDSFYDLNGRKVVDGTSVNRMLRKGIYIHKGKLILKK